MMAKERMTLHFFDNEDISLDLIDSKGIVTTKNIGYTTLRQCIIDSSESFGSVSSGILPPYVICYEYYYHGDNQEIVYVIEYNEPFEDITYHETLYEHFPLPRLIFSFRMNRKHKVKSVKVGVVPLEPITEETPMFYYPFSNIQGEYFKMCIGQNLLHVKKITNLPNLAQFLLRCPNNDDFYKNERNKPELEQRDLMELLKDKDKQYYYDHILIPIPYITVKDFLKE